MKGLFGKRLYGVTVLLLLSMSLGFQAALAEDEIPPEVAIGERLFLETRFSFGALAMGKSADPVMAVTKTVNGDLPGPFRGQQMNCRACHLVDEQLKTRGGGMRSYSDFARRSPITKRSDRNQTSVRNAQQMIDISTPRKWGLSFHYDGEFVTLEDLVHATLTGRNFGWLPSEYQQAVKHIASVVRQDDGKGQLAREFGGAYRKVLSGSNKSIPAEFRLPVEYRINVPVATDEQIISGVTRLIAAYMRGIEFARDKKGRFNGSPYDVFLKKNKLPRQPKKGEATLSYSRRLISEVYALRKPIYVGRQDGKFKFHSQQFVFGPLELAGMKIFFSEQGRRAGNCVKCHTAPVFSDFGFHNTGVSQQEYDGMHSSGAFANLKIPDLAERKKNYNAFLPATAKHPAATGQFRKVVHKNQNDETDLGLWNVYANPDMPKPQKRLHNFMCSAVKHTTEQSNNCSRQNLLPLTIARFKTPILRDLGHSAPFMHNGAFDTVEAVIASYIAASQLAHRNHLRNTAPDLKSMRIDVKDIKPLVAFINALNEDYE